LFRAAAFVACLLPATDPACQRLRTESGVASTAEGGSVVLLLGGFEPAKRAEGEAEIVRRDDRFELRLQLVRVASESPVRVYLVGAARASTTRSVVEAELKYDMEDV
jgi:hypothetical protein